MQRKSRQMYNPSYRWRNGPDFRGQQDPLAYIIFVLVEQSLGDTLAPSFGGVFVAATAVSPSSLMQHGYGNAMWRRKKYDAACRGRAFTSYFWYGWIWYAFHLDTGYIVVFREMKKAWSVGVRYSGFETFCKNGSPIVV